MSYSDITNQTVSLYFDSCNAICNAAVDCCIVIDQCSGRLIKAVIFHDMALALLDDVFHKTW